MPLDPELFLGQAERLARGAENEADYRSAINRAYYACHLTARDALFGVDAGGGRRPSHWAIIEIVAKIEGHDEDANGLRLLKTMREVADYVTDSSHPEVRRAFEESQVEDWEGLAAAALAVAGEIVPRLRRLPPAG